MKYLVLKLKLNNYKILNASIGQKKDDFINKRKVINNKNIVKSIYKDFENNKETQIYSENFVKMNKNRAKIILDNKQYNLKIKIKNQKVESIIKIKINKKLFKF